MNTKYIYFFVLLILILLGVWFLIDYFKNKSAMPDNSSRVLTVAATIHPLGDIVKKIGGDKIKVITILPAGVSPHTFEPKPSDIKNLQTAKAIFVIGHGLDAWSKKLINSVPSVEAYQVDKGITLGKLSFEHHQEEESSKDAQDYDHEHEEGTDPHYWLSPNNGKIIAENVYETLVGLDPVNQSYYLSRLGLLKDELTSLISEAEQKLSPLTNRNLILFHESFNYLANDFNLRVVGVFEPTPGREPTPGQLKNIYDAARRYNVKVIFSEPQFSNETLKPFLSDLNLKMFVLDPESGLNGQLGYVDLLRYNIDTIYQALLND